MRRHQTLSGLRSQQSSWMFQQYEFLECFSKLKFWNAHILCLSWDTNSQNIYKTKQMFLNVLPSLVWTKKKKKHISLVVASSGNTSSSTSMPWSSVTPNVVFSGIRKFCWTTPWYQQHVIHKRNSCYLLFINWKLNI